MIVNRKPNRKVLSNESKNSKSVNIALVLLVLLVTYSKYLVTRLYKGFKIHFWKFSAVTV